MLQIIKLFENVAKMINFWLRSFFEYYIILYLVERGNAKCTVTLKYFEKCSYTNKKGKVLKRLEQKEKPVNISSIIEFISSILAYILFHRNHLHHYRNTIKAFREELDHLFLILILVRICLSL